KGVMGDAFKMFYPRSMRLGKMMLEVQDELESWTRRSRGGAGPSWGHQEEEENDSVLNWARRTLQPDEGGEDGARNGPCSSQSKETMVLELLPYTALLERRRSRGDSTKRTGLERITNVTGKSLEPSVEDFVEEDLLDVQKSAASTAPEKAMASQLEQSVGHLYLTDDDIED
ncbi:MAG: hypothetical protein Q9183_004951, partial [Haloplaca sp. 2 TL-2023]